MKRLIIFSIAAASICASNVAFAAAPKAAVNADGKKIVKKIDRAKLQAAIYKRTGGKLKVPGTQQGTLTYVNAQKKAPVEWLQQNAEVFAKNAKLDIQVKEGAFSFPSPTIVGNATLFVIDDESMPSILHAPEQKWCMVNVAPLAKGAGEKKAFFAARVQKQLTRGFSLLAGSQDSNYPESLLGCITAPEGLDKHVDCRLPVDIMARFTPYLAGYGVKPYVLSTYKKACEEGWAPQPTNDVQKAIWEKVHAMPTSPIKIKPETKKVRE
jgi:hypothetical protein